MAPGLLLQYVLIGLAVVASAVFVMRRQFPGTVRRLRIACALPLLREGRSGWMQRLGRWVAPAPRAGASSCGGCDRRRYRTAAPALSRRGSGSSRGASSPGSFPGVGRRRHLRPAVARS